MEAAQVFLAAAFTVLAVLAAGRRLLRTLDVVFPWQEELLFGFLSGAALLSLAVFALTAAGLARGWVFLALGAACLAAGAFRRSKDSLPPADRLWQAAFYSVFAVFFLMYLSNAAAPENSPDGSGYHLGLVARYLREGRFPTITSNMYASLSQGLEMLFLFAFAFGRHSAAALVHLAFLVSVAWGLAIYGRREGFPQAGAMAALLVFLSPVAGIDATSAYNDVASAALAFGLFYLLQIYDRKPLPQLALLAGLLAGFGYSVKYTGVVGLALAAGWVVWRSRRWRDLGLLAAGAAPSMLPWMIKNLLMVGNPLAPFFNRWFPNQHVTINFEVSYTEAMRHYEGLSSYWRIPWLATVEGAVLQGMLGPVFLLTPIGLWALRSPAGRRIWLAAVVFGAPYLANVGTRFLLPALPFVALSIGLVLGRRPPVALAVVLAHAFLSWPGVLKEHAHPEAWCLRHVPYKAALRIESERGYLERTSPGYRVARMIEEKVEPGANVFSFSQVAEAYTSREILIGYQAARNQTAMNLLWAPLVGNRQPIGRMRFRFPGARLRGLVLRQTATLARGDWCVNEIHALADGKPLPREPQWRVRARPNPWDAGFAFDNSEVTRWCAWEPPRAAMFVEVDFGHARVLDGVLVMDSGDPAALRWRLEGRDETGSWRLLSDRPERWEAPLPLGIRRAATAEVKALGIDYLLIDPAALYGAEYCGEPRTWGLTQVGEESGSRLLRIDP